MIIKIILAVSVLINIGYSYFKGPNAVNYDAAASYCESQRTTLASIVTQSEWEDARSVCGSFNCWIGLRDDLNGNDDMVWSWDDHSDIGSSYGFNADRSATTGQGPWNSGEPNEYQGTDEDCVHMYTTGKYNDNQCSSTVPYPLCNDAPPSSYFKGPDQLTYTAAAAYCQSQGTTLASIGTESDYIDAKSVCGSDYCFIGLRDDLNGNDDMVWSWDDSIDITKSYGFNSDRTATTGQTPWSPGEPNEFQGNDEDCVQIRPSDGKYNDVPCSNLNYPLCNKVRIAKDYFQGPTQLSHGAAQTYCRSQGAKLASIVTQSEWNKANSVCSTCWIGLRDDLNGNDDMIWSWDDGSRISNSYGFNPDRTATTGQGPWNSGEPNEYQGREEDCIEMYNTGKYNDDMCSALNYPLCATDGTAPVITPAPTNNPTTGGVNCCTKRCRKEWSTLSQTERNLYINAFKTLADQGVIQQLSQTHSDSALHSSVYFLPWHRAFVEVLEDAIRGLGGDYECFGMPYWDWSNEPTPTEVSNGETLIIMNSGIGDDSNGGCQNSGSVFDQGQYTPQSSSCLVRNVDYTTDFYCTFATPAAIMQMVGSTTEYSVFDGALEFGAGMHGYPHICIGGNMGTYYSPDDPAFYLHHCYIDYIWALWQDCHDKEAITTTSWSDEFWGSLTQSLSFSPYTTDTYTPGDIMNIEDSNIIYEEGPLFSNVVVDASSNCPGTVNPNWFTDFGSRRRLKEENKSRRRLSQGTGRKRLMPFRHRRSDGTLQDLEVEMEECTDGRMACPVDNIDDFEDCTGMTDDEVNALTVDDIKSMQGLNDCQIAAREGEYDFAKQNGYLRALCNGCMDPVCDQTILWDKCAVYDDNSGGAQSVHGSVNNDHKPNYNENDNYHQFGNNEWMNPVKNSVTIDISSSLLWIICGLMVINIICLGIYCMDNKGKLSKRKGYRVVQYQSEDIEV